MSNTKPHCPYPWFHYLVETDGNAMPCCAYDKKHLPKIHYTEYQNSEFVKNLKSDMMTGIPAGCQSCYQQEMLGGSENRKVANTMCNGWDGMADDNIYFLEIDISNICNLSCRMCDSTKSTKHIQEEIEYKKLYGERTDIQVRPIFKRQDSGWLLTETQAEHIKLLRFLGGEPLLHQENIKDALLKLKDKNRLNQVAVSINTNLTTDIDPELLELLKQTSNNTKITMSFDGFGAVDEYIRHGTIWEEKVQRLRDIAESGLKSKFIYTCQVLNVNKLNELFTFMTDISNEYQFINLPGVPIPVVSPKQYCVGNMPQRAKEKLLKIFDRWLIEYPNWNGHIQSLIKQVNNNPAGGFKEEHFTKNFKALNEFYDKSRNVKLQDVNPELLEILEI